MNCKNTDSIVIRSFKKMKRALVGVSALVFGLTFAQAGLAAQASGSIQILTSGSTLIEGVAGDAQLRIVNTSTEDDYSDIGAVLSAGSVIEVTMACDSAFCTTEIPGTLVFDGCINALPGLSCVPSGANKVLVNVASDITIPPGAAANIVTISFTPTNPVLTNNGVFYLRANTGPNDLRAFSDQDQLFVNGGAQGSRNYNFDPVCRVQLDKQISCDGGQTWNDVGYGDDIARACIATDPTLIMVQYKVRNPSNSLTAGGCTLSESNTTFGSPGAISSIGPNGEITIPGLYTPECSTAVLQEPNTASVSCNLCSGTPVPPYGDEDQANLACVIVPELKVDRNVDCGPLGPNNTGGEADGQLVKLNDDGTLGCSANEGSTVNFEYQAKNESSRTLYDCTFVDTSSIVGANGTPYVIGNLAVGELKIVTSQDLSRLEQVCNPALEASEQPNLGQLNLECCTEDVDGIINCADEKKVTRHDISTVQCLTPGFNVVKECVDRDGNGSEESSVITVVNTGETTLSCRVSDTLAGYGSIDVVPDAFIIEPGQAPVISIGLIPPLTEPALNTATVTCTTLDGSLVGTREATDTCNVPNDKCLTRTPGFWGTHPAVTQKYLEVEVCGVTLDNVRAGNSTSAIEAMCSVGKDGKIMGPQMTQLVRQCTAAALNIAASKSFDGDCNNAEGSEGIDRIFASCCGSESICTDDPIEGFSINSCIGALDAFNNLPNDTLNFDFKTGPADSSVCRASKDNKVVVDPTP